MATVSGYQLDVAGGVTLIEIDADDLPTLQELVEGWIELVSVRFGAHRLVLVVNEEGRITGLPVNPTTTALYGAIICGRVAVFGVRPDGELADCPVEITSEVANPHGGRDDH